MWKIEKGNYKRFFSSRETWLSIRERHPKCSWYHAVWFKHATLKYSVILWIAMNERLTTGDMMIHW